MAILELLDVPVSWVLVQFYTFFSTFMDPSSGWTWALSIVGLVILMRIVLIPLFVKQIKAQRGLQIIQPKMKEIQKKYAGDRERQSQEMMKLYRETGTNPLASCLPILLQAPIFFGLFRVLQYGIAQESEIGVFAWPQYKDLVYIAHDATIFDVPLWATFWLANVVQEETGTSALTVRILAGILIIAMSTTTFLTQRQLIVKNTAPDNPMVRQQKILLYVFPLVFLVGGINFPVGVLIYWFTTNLWSMGQQFYVIRNNPQPGTPAFEANEARKKEKAARKAARKGLAPDAAGNGDNGAVEEVPDEASVKRVQPKKASRSKRKKKR
jgi:YidC/Oxa1 family membrane protein insertase